eukprot:CAMPEP_0171090594 /NCGR_PEP_ID=MMETSP0766_2-20121228/31957_1 /TAXON_ID=439317 /ORGANISM="Gambierdiscus australes, Strain CAWD 149" /LENGTH=226 /DNA_ID=CAMNT_0011548607 /DNA_START=81 /DNA_END=761 /DNA_ORIENTATION=+
MKLAWLAAPLRLHLISRQNLTKPGYGLAKTAQQYGLDNVRRGVHVMRNSWPSLRQPADPSKPSVAQVIRQMDSNKTSGRFDPQKVAAQPAEASERRKHARHLPDSVYPAATATPSAVSAPSIAQASTRMAKVPPRGAPSLQWQVPIWNAVVARQRGLPVTPRSPRRQKDISGGERHVPAFEVWGMRILGVLFLGVACVELSAFSWGPAGLTRKPRPRLASSSEDSH